MSSTAQPQQPSPKAGSPNDFLKGVIGKNVNVRLNSGIDYRGVLSCLDGYMNIALEQTVEYVDGVKKNAYGDAFIRVQILASSLRLQQQPSSPTITGREAGVIDSRIER
ncbi:hypothetical protein PHSY_004938 [Pseudozyma hubeiensis SY62]|uniref:U6 snRNA-associated Sm-like protein LSm6 n=1 Tax=Pseudozyma hubeiensis (strain SY62) TaxID=1305764 RepID=R9P7K0_PSEHS|nr:hypothetical protein PHSY_004938 [Pseudozyma hubeiensis SY62]GAC97353.1 hypothetical protein PHSY_004938 [Pseudozyma hubeiensis SY62]